jgi:hypothetical protein
LFILDQRGFRISAGRATSKVEQRSFLALGTQSENRSTTAAARVPTPTLQSGAVEVTGPVAERTGDRVIPGALGKVVQHRFLALRVHLEERSTAAKTSCSAPTFLTGAVKVSSSVHNQTGRWLCGIRKLSEVVDHTLLAAFVDSEYCSVATSASPVGCAIEIASFTTHQPGVRIASIGRARKTMEHCFTTVLVNPENGAASVPEGAVRGSSTELRRAVQVAPSIQDQAGLRCSSVVSTLEYIKDFESLSRR